MIAFGFRALVGLATAYLAVLAILFVLQSRFIYPAPQEVHDPAEGFAAVELATSDELLLTAHYRPAQDAKSTIVWFHGNGGSLAGAVFETQILAARGYGLLLVSYRGYGGNPGSPSEQGFYRDGRAAIAFLAEQGIAAEQTIMASNSIGSGTAVQMAEEFSPAAVMLTAPFTSLPDAASEALPVFPVRWLLRDRFDNASKLPALDMPILILHGDADNVVPFAHGRRLAESNPRAQFAAFEGAGHDLSFWREAQDAQANWLAENGF